MYGSRKVCLEGEGLVMGEDEGEREEGRDGSQFERGDCMEGRRGKRRIVI